ncbi:Two-component response regulator [Hyphomicrobium sulfonivorans]|uniref:Two-component response regulator n=1 Tax=Hyphomicrobium sulfonivorans TaxID=121290 RepID=A0A109BRN7_HYPSL|nr:response regulator [Hyphomicrobium sulfonivorans]KWT72992.1 Two-component response regulator [Hyphomicrobium sulfonivorans]
MNALALIAEDDAEVAEILDAYLVREGLRTVRAADGRTAIELNRTLKPDIVLLDVKMPKADGYEVLANIRQHGSVPVIMVTALDEDLDKLQALRIGADDYVVKPFNPLEVVARVKAVLRRTQGHQPQTVLRVGPIEIDESAHVAYLDAVASGRVRLELTLTEFRILAHMARSPSRVFSRSELIDACLPESEALERTVDSHASNLRKKLETAGARGYFESVRGVGYRLTTLP